MSVSLPMPLWVQGMLALGPSRESELPAASANSRNVDPRIRLESVVGRCKGGPIIPFNLDAFDANIAVHLVEAVLNRRSAIAAIYSDASMTDVGWLEFGQGVNNWHDAYAVPKPAAKFSLKPWLRDTTQELIAQLGDAPAMLDFSIGHSLQWTVRAMPPFAYVGPVTAGTQASARIFESGREHVLRGVEINVRPEKLGWTLRLSVKVPESILQISAFAERSAWIGVEYGKLSVLFPIGNLDGLSQSLDVWVTGVAGGRYAIDSYFLSPMDVGVEVDECRLAAISVHRRWLLGSLNRKFVAALQSEWEPLNR